MAINPGDDIVFDSCGSQTRGRVWCLAPHASVWVTVSGQRDPVLVKLASPRDPGNYAVPADWRSLLRGIQRIDTGGAVVQGHGAGSEAHTPQCERSRSARPVSAVIVIGALLGKPDALMGAPHMCVCLTG